MYLPVRISSPKVALGHGILPNPNFTAGLVRPGCDLKFLQLPSLIGYVIVIVQLFPEPFSATFSPVSNQKVMLIKEKVAQLQSADYIAPSHGDTPQQHLTRDPFLPPRHNMKQCSQNRVKLAFSILRPKSSTWIVTAEILNSEYTRCCCGCCVRSGMTRNPSVQAEEGFSPCLLDAINTTSASSVLPSIVPPLHETQIYNVSGSRIKPISCLCSSHAGKRLTMVGNTASTTSSITRRSSKGNDFYASGRSSVPTIIYAHGSPATIILREELMGYICLPLVEELVQTDSSLGIPSHTSMPSVA
ncbi:uncharacterized protein BJ212DRAFT_1348535 [Suillus subaureus]|uniref:Uncharacterized protein n=1 Tax=Suillus subaureus TaxID=48587 RepID=A0A9P7ECU8_9AGAM|nr:uncharacterized protein BJ212DRAFT_1348535 [Suillus subaureus]KAG1818052.1 hypothetical protein BJ212DRAFT_1348535 [Suillus subaureus]